MNRDEARQILAAFRPGSRDEEDPFFEEALKAASSDPELASWFAAEQAFDAAVSGKLQAASAPPAGLRERLRGFEPSPSPRWTLPRALGLAGAAALAAFMLAMTIFRAPEPSTRVAGTAENFRQEMVSFVRLPPPLDLQAEQTAPLVAWMREAKAPVPGSWPRGLETMPAAGCRTLLFNRRKVALYCFVRKDGQLAHLFVVDTEAFPDGKIPGHALIDETGGFASALWAEGGKVYLLATAGRAEQVREIL